MLNAKHCSRMQSMMFPFWLGKHLSGHFLNTGASIVDDYQTY